MTREGWPIVITLLAARQADVETGVPILSKIPILKRLFNNRASLRRANNLLILIRPKIIIQAEEEHSQVGVDNF